MNKQMLLRYLRIFSVKPLKINKPVQNEPPKYLTNKYQLDTEEENDLEATSGKYTQDSDDSDSAEEDTESKKLRVFIKHIHILRSSVFQCGNKR